MEVDGKKERRKYVKFDLRVVEGKQAYIENIIIKGNKKTLDKVIRREIIVREGELFNSYKMQLSRDRIYALGYFKEVNIDIRPGSKDDQMNLIIDVVEQPTGTISVGGGYGTNTGLSIFADLGETNLGGRGQSVNLRFEYGPERASVSLSFREPWLFDYPIAFSSSVFYNLYTIETTSIFTESDEKAEYKKQSFGYSLGLSYRFWYWWSVGANWGHSFKNVLETSGNSTDAVLLEEALGYQRSVRLQYTCCVTPSIIRLIRQRV